MRVMKYGGSSLATTDQVKKIAENLAELSPLVIVLSAPYGKTNALYAALDAVEAQGSCAMNHYLSLGEMESCYLMQLALNYLGHAAEVLDYTKIGITASQQHGGHITHIDPSYILRSLEKGVSAIIPGFQGLFQDQLAILSRGASDETAIAIAASLQLQCEIHSDVSHIYNEDRTPLSTIDYDTLYAMITHDQKPMSKRSIILAQKHNLSLRFRHWSSISGGTLITKQPSEEINSVS